MGARLVKATVVRVGFVVPLLGYTLWSLASAAPAWSLAELAALGVSAGPVLSGIARRPTAWPNLSWIAVGLAILLSYGAGAPQWNSVGSPLAVGLVLCSPIAVFGTLLVGRRSMPASILVSTLALAVSAFDFAVVRQLRSSSTGPFDTAAWSAAIHAVGAGQLLSLGVPALGGAPGSPLGYLGDSIGDLFGLFVVLGLLISLILPSSRTPELVDEPGSGASASRPRSARAPGPAGTASVVASTTALLPDTAYQVTGVASLVVALVAVLLFQFASTDDSFPNVAAMAVAVVSVVLALVVLADRGAVRALPVGPAPLVRRRTPHGPRAGRATPLPGSPR
ncbi:MAG TPA: hypothetical protein VGS18_02520 [Thermoplasmata archaeon]|nr:hypothetical protein [Thermoplasmata archaeon]